MTKKFMEERTQGHRPRVSEWNTLVQLNNSIELMMGTKGMRIQKNPFGFNIINDKGDVIFKSESGPLADMFNDSTSVLESYIPVGITGQFFDDDAKTRITSERIFTVENTKSKDGLFWGVTAEPIPGMQRKRGVVVGTALVNMRRWFPTPFNRVDIFFDSTLSGPTEFPYIVPNPAGLAEILWEEEGVATNVQHDAIVNITGSPFARFPWKNNTGTTVKYGQALTFASSVNSDNEIGLKIPDEDDLQNVYINMGGEVKIGESGSAIFTESLFMAEVDQEVSAGDDVGTKANDPKFFLNNGGFQVSEFLGAKPGGRLFALIFRTGGGAAGTWSDWES